MADLYLELLLTKNCNLACDYCYVKKSTSRMSLSRIWQAIRYFYRNRTLEINFFGGEPLLEAKNIVRTILLAKKLRLALDFALPTNGILLTKKLTEFFLKNKVRLSLSYDGATSQPLRGKSPKKGLTEHCHKVISKQNYSHLVTDIISLKKAGYRYVTVAVEKSARWCARDVPLLQKRLHSLANWYFKTGRNNFKLAIFEEYFKRAKIIENKNYLTCGAGVNRFAVDALGDIYPCSWFASMNKQKLGSIYRGHKIWVPKRLRNKQCASCEVLEYCEGGCLACNYQKNGSIQKTCQEYCRMQKGFFTTLRDINNICYINK